MHIVIRKWKIRLKRKFRRENTSGRKECERQGQKRSFRPERGEESIGRGRVNSLGLHSTANAFERNEAAGGTLLWTDITVYAH